ncbi:inositol monophosphatase 1 [Exaiptasia diaphana]|uniref:Inositol-1-monophosphatase n=1 Tax=Exaiptasia diaphana TaxID=2652724 RepID=A0A913XLZ8_EXADI|nr:inositol monophosphatase 1 [Exaiptasia diaphana]KXJ10826.1 Inositol monophosphatase 1 [Exaiptasia diaphana]
MAEATQLQEYLDSAVDIARKAGEVINEAFHKEKIVSTKVVVTDLVTETDQYVEKLVIGTLKDKYPTHSFIGEESVSAGEPCNLTDNPTWIIDPIDGTTSFIHRYPLFCISIGLSINREIHVAVVYNSVLDEMYTAVKGKGAYLNGRKILATDVTEIGKSLIITELGYNREKSKLDPVFKNLRSISEGPNAAHGVRFQGSAAYNLCTVARGAAEAYYEFGVHCWDIAAGILILTEAGGVVTSPSGGPLDIMARFVMGACTDTLAKSICQKLEVIEHPSD